MTKNNLKRLLFQTNSDKIKVLGLLKNQSNFYSFNKKLDSVISHPFVETALFGGLLPKSPEEIFRRNLIPNSNNIESEVAWIIRSILPKAKRIEMFLSLKSRYENSMLLNDFDKSEKLLDQIEKDICCSIWGIKNRILLEEERTGTESNWLKLNEYNNLIKDPITLFLIEQESKKSETKLTYFRFKEEFARSVEKTNEFFREYLCFRLDYITYTGFKNFAFILNLESVSPLIDRYLFLIDIMVEIAANEVFSFVQESLQELTKSISNDSRLNSLTGLVMGDLSQIMRSEFDDLIAYIDQYFAGNYETVLQNASQIINSYPSQIEVYIFYIRSLIESNQPFRELNNASVTINFVLEKLFNLYQLNGESQASLADLLKVVQKYFSFSFGKQLFGFLSQFSKVHHMDVAHRLHAVSSSDFIGPSFLTFFNDFPKMKPKNFEKRDLVGNYAKLMWDVHLGDRTAILIESANEISIKQSLYLKVLFLERRYKEIVDYYKKNDELKSIPITLQKEQLEVVYDAFLSLKSVLEACVFFVNCYICNPNLANFLDKKRLITELKAFKGSISLIEIPVFVFLSEQDPYDQYVYYDEFLTHKGFVKPSDFLKSVDPNPKVVLFLREICNIEVMHHSMAFDNTEDIELERTVILKYLLQVDPKNENKYIKELTEISQKSKIRRAISAVNKGRISINIEQLKAKEEIALKDSFQRFKELVEFSKEYGHKSPEFTSKMLNQILASITDPAIRNRIVNINDPAYISFKSIFTDLRDKFILSKEYGLDGYLSTRIRHGSFANHIRSIFESKNLLCQKKDGQYSDNNFWATHTPLNLESQSKQIQEAIKKFSKEIDDYTEYIIKELIQIKTENRNQKPHALFDFTLSDKFLAWQFSKNDIWTTHKSFLEYVFTVLEEQVKSDLKTIRDYFNSNVKEKYTTIINDLAMEIRTIIGETPFVNLINSISVCQTIIQNEINSIIEWFNISMPSTDNVLDLKTIVETSLEITNTIYPSKRLRADIFVNENIHFQDGINLIYVVRNLLDNIIKHSSCKESDYGVVIRGDYYGNGIELIVENKIDIRSQNEINENLKQAKELWQQNGDFSRINIEDKSGFHKIRRILEVDMNFNSQFDYNIIEDRLSIHIRILNMKFFFIDEEVRS